MKPIVETMARAIPMSITLLITVATVILSSPQESASAQSQGTAIPSAISQADLTDAVIQALHDYPNATTTQIKVATVKVQAAWSFGYADISASSDPHSIPQSYVFVAHQVNGRWQVGVQSTPLFQTLRSNAPAGLMNDASPSQSLSGNGPSTVAYNRSAAVSFAQNNYNNPGIGSGECTGLSGGAMQAGGLSGPNTGWIGNHQIVNWVAANPDKAQIVKGVDNRTPGDIILFTQWDDANVQSHWPYSFDHSGVYLGSDNEAQWNSSGISNIYQVRVYNNAHQLVVPNLWLVHINDSLPPPPANTNLLQNGDFGAGFNNWNKWGPMAWAIYSTSGHKYLAFKHETTNDNGGIYQFVTQYAVAPNSVMEVQIALGNNSSVTKTVDVDLRNYATWTGSISCTFTIQPNTPLHNFIVRAKTDGATWNGLSFELFVAQRDGIPDVSVYNASVQYRPDLSVNGTACLTGDFTSPDNGSSIGNTVHLAGYTSSSNSSIVQSHFTASWPGHDWIAVSPDFSGSSLSYDWNMCDQNIATNTQVTLGLDFRDANGNWTWSPNGNRSITRNSSPCFIVGQNAGTWNNQTSAFWTDQFNQVYIIMNRPAPMATDASTGSQFTNNGDVMIANPGANRVFWVGSGIANILKANNYPFDRVIGQNEAWGSLGLIGPPTTNEVWMGGTVWQVCFTNGCLSDNYGTVTYVPWPSDDPTSWHVNMFNDLSEVGGLSMVRHWSESDQGFFMNGGPGQSPDPFLQTTNYVVDMYKNITFTGGSYQFQASTLGSNERVIVYDQLSPGYLNLLLNTAGSTAGQMVYATANLTTGTHRIRVLFVHADGNGYGMTASWQLIVTPTPTPSATNTYTPLPPTLTNTPVPPKADTIGIYRNGTFYMRKQNTTGFADITVAYNPATQPYPIVGDWTGGGIDTVGVYDQSNGQFMLRNSNTPGDPDETFGLGIAGDQPLNGRWQVSATHSGVGVFRPSNGLIYLKNDLSTGYADYTMVLGIPGDVGVAGDWSGQGFDSPGAYRPSTTKFYLSNQVTNGGVFGDYEVQLGIPGDVPIVGDWIGQGHDGIAVFRVSNGLIYMKDVLTSGYADRNMVYGIANDIPVAGHWSNNAAASIAPVANLIVPNTPNAVTATPTATQPAIRITGQPNYDG